MSLLRSPLTIFLLHVITFTFTAAAAPRVCIIGAGIGGATLSHYLSPHTASITIFERSATPGGRMATVSLSGDVYEAGASIIHPKNLHALRFAALLNLTHAPKSLSLSNPDGSFFGVWDGAAFRFQTLPDKWRYSFFYRKFRSFMNFVVLFKRYRFDLIRLNGFVKEMVDKFMGYYKEEGKRPVFETVEEMLRWTGLYGLTQRTLKEELVEAGFSQLMISELVTVITRINYGQSVGISGLAGAVSLAGSDSGLWSVDGGNWQIAAELIKHSKAELHLNEEIESIAHEGEFYVLNSTNGNSYTCEVTVIATPLDELNISFTPSVSIPARKLQHTFTTFVRGLINPKYFGLECSSEVPDLIGTIEDPDIPFSSISILKKYSKEDMSHKIFSRSPLGDDILDLIFSVRTETVRIDWPAYPHYEAPEVFAPIILDQAHLYYVNSFESGASTIECSAVAAENVARLIISRLSKPTDAGTLKMPPSGQQILHTDL